MGKLKTRQSRRSWSRSEKRRLVERAHGLVEEGCSWEAAAKQLGVWPSSLLRWRDQARLDSESIGTSPGFRQVQVVDAPSNGLRVTTPHGFVVEGLDLESTTLLLEMLR